MFCDRKSPSTIQLTEKRWKIQAVRAFLNECTGKKFSAKLILAQCRQQGNSVDCAVYTCLNLRSLVERVDVNFPRMPGSHMKKATKDKLVANLRVDIAKEIETTKLMPWV